MIIYYIVFRTIYTNTFFWITLPLLFLLVFHVRPWEKRRQVYCGDLGTILEILGGFFCWDIGDIGSGRGPLGPAVEISVQHQIHAINFVFFLLLVLLVLLWYST